MHFLTKQDKYISINKGINSSINLTFHICKTVYIDIVSLFHGVLFKLVTSNNSARCPCSLPYITQLNPCVYFVSYLQFGMAISDENSHGGPRGQSCGLSWRNSTHSVSGLPEIYVRTCWTAPCEWFRVSLVNFHWTELKLYAWIRNSIFASKSLVYQYTHKKNMTYTRPCIFYGASRALLSRCLCWLNFLIHESFLGFALTSFKQSVLLVKTSVQLM